jgi:hypothetical protein
LIAEYSFKKLFIQWCARAPKSISGTARTPSRKELEERNQLLMMLDNLSEGTDLKETLLIFSQMMESISAV